MRLSTGNENKQTRKNKSIQVQSRTPIELQTRNVNIQAKTSATHDDREHQLGTIKLRTPRSHTIQSYPQIILRGWFCGGTKKEQKLVGLYCNVQEGRKQKVTKTVFLAKERTTTMDSPTSYRRHTASRPSTNSADIKWTKTIINAPKRTHLAHRVRSIAPTV